jgi:hypothetical protein
VALVEDVDFRMGSVLTVVQRLGAGQICRNARMRTLRRRRFVDVAVQLHTSRERQDDTNENQGGVSLGIGGAQLGMHQRLGMLEGCAQLQTEPITENRDGTDQSKRNRLLRVETEPISKNRSGTDHSKSTPNND